jgi:uncharacterized protein YjhX (UPF0386 family)
MIIKITEKERMILMATHAFIGIRDKDGEIWAVYCHRDGYIHGGVGETLFKHYQDKTKIRELLDGGDISDLSPRIDAPEGHSFLCPAEDCTVFYIRDRKEDVRPNIKQKYTLGYLFRYASKESNAYVYVFDEKEHKWLVGKKGHLTPLSA